jgi:hypothetical protein
MNLSKAKQSDGTEFCRSERERMPPRHSCLAQNRSGNRARLARLWRICRGGQPSSGTLSIIAFLQERNCYWHFSYFFRADNFRANPTNVVPNRGDINILAVQSGREQPQDLPEIATPQEDWTKPIRRFIRTAKSRCLSPTQSFGGCCRARIERYCQSQVSPTFATNRS